MIDVRRNHRELITLSKSTSDSAIRFCGTKQAVSESGSKRQKGRGELTVFDSPQNTWSYSLSVVQKMMLVTLSKQ